MVFCGGYGTPVPDSTSISTSKAPAVRVESVSRANGVCEWNRRRRGRENRAATEAGDDFETVSEVAGSGPGGGRGEALNPTPLRMP